MFEKLLEARFLGWNRLESIANNEAAKIITLVPIIGFLILFNDSVAELISFEQIAGLDGSEQANPFFLSSLIKMRLAFFGSISLFIANLTFRFFAPDVLRFSKSDYQFAEHVLDSYSMREIECIEAEVVKPSWKHRTDVATDLNQKKNFRYVGAFSTKHQFEKTDEDWVKAMSREWWHSQNHSGPAFRISVFLFSIFGYIMLALPTIDITQAVLQDMLL